MTHAAPTAKETEALFGSTRLFIQHRRENKVYLGEFCRAFRKTERQFYRWSPEYRPPFVKHRGRWELDVSVLQRWLEEQERDPGVK